MARRGPLCRVALIAFLCLYVVAGAAAVLGAFGVFGEEGAGPAAMGLALLGMPWVLTIGFLPRDFPVLLAAVLGAFAPVLNLWLLDLACRSSRRRRM